MKLSILAIIASSLVLTGCGDIFTTHVVDNTTGKPVIQSIDPNIGPYTHCDAAHGHGNTRFVCSSETLQVQYGPWRTQYGNIVVDSVTCFEYVVTFENNIVSLNSINSDCTNKLFIFGK